MRHENPTLDGRPALEIVMTVLHAGGKFDDKSYAVSGGLHGVGVSVVNALSQSLVVEVCRGGRLYTMRFEKGKVVKGLEDLGETDQTGTRNLSDLVDPALGLNILMAFDINARGQIIAIAKAGLPIKPAPTKASAATPCAPPTLKTRSTPATAAAASTSSLRTPPGVGTTITSSLTPATFAGIAFISTDDGYAALPPGTYRPARSRGVIC